LNPVRVSAYRAPAAAAILASSVEDTPWRHQPLPRLILRRRPLQQAGAEQRAHLVSGEHPPATVRLRHGYREASPSDRWPPRARLEAARVG